MWIGFHGSEHLHRQWAELYGEEHRGKAWDQDAVVWRLHGVLRSHLDSAVRAGDLGVLSQMRQGGEYRGYADIHVFGIRAILP